VGARAAREQFLQEKIDHEAATVAKLINLPHQHALLVLRVCVQQNLRHLQRSLKSDDLVHLWDKLDTTLREALRNSSCDSFGFPAFARSNSFSPPMWPSR
jgi:hypothetical protein